MGPHRLDFVEKVKLVIDFCRVTNTRHYAYYLFYGIITINHLFTL